jgi:RNA polymerase sigma factor (sigma-70 family)
MQDMEVVNRYLETQASLCFSELYNRYSGKIYSKCMSLLKDEELAQDATQEVFTKIFLNLSKFGERAKFSTWVYSITYNFCIDYLRRKKKMQNLFADDKEVEKLADIADEVPDEALMEMEVKQLRTVLDAISVDDKAVLLMKYQDDMSIRDISEMLNKTESAIKMKLKRAKEKAFRLKGEMFMESVL